jgi:hypothetical protein
VDPEEGLTGILLIESGKPTTKMATTAEDEEHLRQSEIRWRGAK